MPSPSTSALAELLELTARKLHSRGHVAGLFPAQWAALRYFSRAPEELRTSSELARFQGLANGPVSRTVRTLVQKGLLAKAAEQPKGRAERLELTVEGEALLDSDPTHAVEAAIDGVAPGDCEALARALESIVAQLEPRQD
ncbi:MAG: MarR family transcriptional regulator [Candidatus Devosia phytovorans]|uniref:MarR family transcriptional regulator n=1 Tax=Candidatus Devosia phytovorans TaxID=3121372 RepID=A0AAJ5VRW2_9HYPH|nr:MarR family transcriptional regulator [Devosia sp.]WEK02995.1 MAG: MarR family transcriptional regulator [Devosia sp.]